jgi:hypothetical protein
MDCRPIRIGRPQIFNLRLICPQFLRRVATCVAGGARKFFREGEVIGASVNDAPDPGSLLKNEGMLTTDVGDFVDTQGDPATAERKRRRAAVPENSLSAAETGMDAGRAAPKKS